jgi:hypothetical protein
VPVAAGTARPVWAGALAAGAAAGAGSSSSNTPARASATTTTATVSAPSSALAKFARRVDMAGRVPRRTEGRLKKR